jgi:hypothetical protein
MPPTASCQNKEIYSWLRSDPDLTHPSNSVTIRLLLPSVGANNRTRAVKPITHCLLVTFLVGMTVPMTAQPQRFVDRQPAGPGVGDKAPDFKLKTKDGQREVEISSFKGQKPVVLVFGSFT